MNTDLHFSSESDNWATPQHLFDKLNSIMNFDLDPCADVSNAKCARYYNKEMNGLALPWNIEGVTSVFMNPPYGREIPKWMKKAASEAEHVSVVSLIPARVDTKWFHEYCFGSAKVICFVKGRLKFGNQQNSAPFPSAITIHTPSLGDKELDLIDYLRTIGHVQ